MTLRGVPLIVLVLLASAPAAGAKEMRADVCGASRCVTVSDHGQTGRLHSTGTPRAAPDPAPFYVVRFRSARNSRAPIAWSYIYVPSAKAMRGSMYGSGRERWMRASFLHPLITKLTRGLAPYPTSRTWRAG